VEEHRHLIALAGVIVFGTSAQWISAKMRLPSILLLLVSGFLAGPILQIIVPDKMFGELLFPFVSLCVAIILFEGALSLKLSELRQIGMSLGYLLTIGVFITWGLAALGAVYILGFDRFPAILLGAILVVTGPTVIGPILRQIRPIGQVGQLVRWEGIVIDPVGAVLAVLVFEAHHSMLHGAEAAESYVVAKALFLTLFYGTTLGAAAAYALAWLLKRHAIPDHLENLITMLFVIVPFTASNILQEESGLLAVTVMGVVLANSNVVLKHIVEFKESLSLLLISGLFILLAARVELADFKQLGWQGPLFVAFMIIIVRPASVWASTYFTDLNWREKVLVSWLAPRGIVAAAVASIFAIELGKEGNTLVPATFLVIVGTVVVYGLTAFPLARWLGLATSDPQGVLVVGAHDLARAIGDAIQQAGYPVLLVDTNRWNLRQAKMSGLPAVNVNILSDKAKETLDLGGIGRLLAMTPNDEVNALGAMHFGEMFGRANTFQLTPWRTIEKNQTVAQHLQARYLFDEKGSFDNLMVLRKQGWKVKVTKLSEEFDFEDYQKQYGPDAILMFVSQNQKLTVVDADHHNEPKPGQTLISFVDPEYTAPPEIASGTDTFDAENDSGEGTDAENIG